MPCRRTPVPCRRTPVPCRRTPVPCQCRAARHQCRAARHQCRAARHQCRAARHQRRGADTSAVPNDTGAVPHDTSAVPRTPAPCRRHQCRAARHQCRAEDTSAVPQTPAPCRRTPAPWRLAAAARTTRGARTCPRARWDEEGPRDNGGHFHSFSGSVSPTRRASLGDPAVPEIVGDDGMRRVPEIMGDISTASRVPEPVRSPQADTAPVASRSPPPPSPPSKVTTRSAKTPAPGHRRCGAVPCREAVRAATYTRHHATHACTQRLNPAWLGCVSHRRAVRPGRR